MVAAVTVRKNKFAEMAFVGETPWHGLGQRLDDGASLETWREQAGMDWTIASSPLTYANGLVFEGKQALYRQDDPETHLGIVSDRYQVVQPGEVLEFFRDLVEDQGLKLNTAGTLFGGKRFWALASLNDGVDIVRKDRVNGFVLLATSADGSLATTAQFTTVRVVCNNTLSMSVAEGKKAKGDRVAVRHSSVFDASQVKTALGVAPQAMQTFKEQMQALAGRTVQVDEATDLVHGLLLSNKLVSSVDPLKSKATVDILKLFDGGAKGADLVGRSAWGLLNAVTEYVDHSIKARSDSHRLDSAWFGRGAKVKEAARARLLELV